MRQMIRYPRQHTVNQFRCTDCEWAFYVQRPITPDLDLEAQEAYAAGWFADHSCAQFQPKPSPSIQATFMAVRERSDRPVGRVI